MTDNLWDAWKIITKGLLKYGNCPLIGEAGGDDAIVEFYSYDFEDGRVYSVEVTETRFLEEEEEFQKTRGIV